jgi:hypothetical protein
MSAQDNLGRQWQQPELSFTVHRGITRKPQKGRWLGMHWSADPQVARRFAGPFGHVIHGEVPMSSVETNPSRLRQEGVINDAHFIDPSKAEREVPVSTGKSMKVTGVTGPEADPKTGYWNGRRNESAPSASGAKRPPRKRTYKKPKDMTA